ncbi:hypothetical protein FGL98_14605 [Leekyejoonella antrihumi]|uniref:GPI inositol-deacylase PGAP1-like alpha/beta domain-containing protein n=1 Tax=Leekyejoonella antrihumi TaxID=1660198 RepID=A0A563DYF4_9MICO|nr:hypothetical protein FGL98_14605 [Leekyejoonella antrihumi]
MPEPRPARPGGADTRRSRDGTPAAHPEASGMVAVLLHGSCEDDTNWQRGGEHAATYLDTLTRLGWTPVVLLANTCLPVRENGIALSALLQDLVASWPVEVRRITLVGHSMGGLIMRAAAAASIERPWAPLVSDVITLGTPHHGSPVAQGGQCSWPWARAAARDGAVWADPRPPVAGRRGSRGGFRLRGPAVAPRALPTGGGDAVVVAATPGRPRGGRPARAGAVGGVRSRTVRGGRVPRCRHAAFGPGRSLRSAEPPAGARRPREVARLNENRGGLRVSRWRRVTTRSAWRQVAAFPSGWLKVATG